MCRCHVCGNEFQLADLTAHRFSTNAERFSDGRVVLACQNPDGGPAHPSAEIRIAWQSGAWREQQRSA